MGSMPEMHSLDDILPLLEAEKLFERIRNLILTLLP
jgi:hypothetical protein